MMEYLREGNNDVPKSAQFAGLMPTITEACEGLRLDHDYNGTFAAKQHLRRQLEAIAEGVDALLTEHRASRVSLGQTDGHLPDRLIRQLIRASAQECERYFGTFAGLFRRNAHDEFEGTPSATLSLQCMEVLFVHLLHKDAAITPIDEVIYRSWLGLLIEH